MKKGNFDLATFLFSIIIIGLMGISVMIMRPNTNLEFYYLVEGATRFQGCDVTLLSMLRSPVQLDEGYAEYDFADALAMSDSDEQDIIIDKANEILAGIYGTQDVDEDNIIVQENIIEMYAGIGDYTKPFCTQYLPTIEDGRNLEVGLIDNSE